MTEHLFKPEADGKYGCTCGWKSTLRFRPADADSADMAYRAWVIQHLLVRLAELEGASA